MHLVVPIKFYITLTHWESTLYSSLNLRQRGKEGGGGRGEERRGQQSDRGDRVESCWAEVIGSRIRVSSTGAEIHI
jgi:hypothetical protein